MSLPSPKICIADDEPRGRQLLADLLAPEGYQLSLAVDGEEALAQVLLEQPDLVLLDVMMPRLNGFEVCRRVRQNAQTAHIPILMVTALDGRADRLTGIQAGANDFLNKPVDNFELRLRVRNAVYQQRLYNELQNRYQELKAMAELRESLTSMIEADTEALSSLMRQPTQPERALDGNPQEGGDHGTR